MSRIATKSTVGRVIRANGFWLRLPLKEPYENAIERLDAFDALLVRLEDDLGRVGWGEACPVRGYSPEGPEEAWTLLRKRLPAFIGTEPSGVHVAMADVAHGFPFVVAALAEAAEDLTDDALLRRDDQVTLALAGTVNTLDPDAAPAYAEKLVSEGYRTLKTKVGYDPMRDARRIAAIAEAVAGRARIRVDANQGYDREAALAFAQAVPKDAIEAFEQPVAADDWPAMRAVAANAGLPIMLDEAIYGEDDIRRAAEMPGVDAVKLKLSKTGGAGGLVRQIDIARGLGLRVVVGNGVASDLGCLHEAIACANAGLDTAGEMNGFLKTKARLVGAPLRVADGELVVPPLAVTSIVDDWQQWIVRIH
jgi:o-succinylbenzoate synthase